MESDDFTSLALHYQISECTWACPNPPLRT